MVSFIPVNFSYFSFNLIYDLALLTFMLVLILKEKDI